MEKLFDIWEPVASDMRMCEAPNDVPEAETSEIVVMWWINDAINASFQYVEKQLWDWHSFGNDHPVIRIRTRTFLRFSKKIEIKSEENLEMYQRV